MPRVVIELTNRCNLSCQHCFAGRHGGGDDLPLDVLQVVLDGAMDAGFDHLAFTGGDPTVHPAFPDAVKRAHDAGYRYSFVTNGWNFSSIYRLILPYREGLTGIAFSIDGADEATHDALRGRHSFQRLLKSVSICVALGLPFTFNMVVSSQNRHQLRQMATLASGLRAGGLRFIHLMPTMLSHAQGLDLSPSERKAVEAEIRQLQADCDLPVSMAAGFHTTDLFPCSPLNLQEVNVDCHGNLTTCCQISGHGPGTGQDDVIASLAETSFGDAYAMLVEHNRAFREAKSERFERGNVPDTDYFPCWFCSVQYGKVDWIRRLKGHEWAGHLRQSTPVVSISPSAP